MKMGFCCVPQCPNDKKINPNTIYHRFPLRDAALIKRWTVALNVSSKNTTDMLVCSDHFSDNDYFSVKIGSQQKRLKRGRVPSRNLPKRRVADVQTVKRSKGTTQDRGVGTTNTPHKGKTFQDHGSVLKAVGLKRSHATLVPQKSVSAVVTEVRNSYSNSSPKVTSSQNNKTISGDSQSKDGPSVTFLNSRFGKLLNDTSMFFSEVCKELEASSSLIQNKQSKSTEIRNENSTETSITTAVSADKLSTMVESLFEIVLPEESMACSEENHKGTQTRVLKKDRSIQTDFGDRELRLLRENADLKRQISGLKLTVNTLEKFNNPGSGKVVYLLKQ